MFARLSTCLLCLLLCAPSRVAAQDAGVRVVQTPLQVEVHSERKLAATHAEDPSASGTSLDLTDRVTMPRSLGDVVRESPGAQVVSTGGIGAFSSLALRGAASEETLVLLDEIPLTTADGGAFDLSLFPAELFDKVNVFRGGAPVWLGSGAIGGVLQLVPHRGSRNRSNMQLGAGSFGTYQLNGGVEASTPDGISAHSQLVVRGTQGDYPYRDDRGTVFDKSDDQTFRLKNADFTEASGVQDLTVPLWKGTLHLVALGLVRGGGLSGPAAQPTPQIRRESSRALTAAAYTVEAGDSEAFKRRLQIVAAGSFGADRFTDLLGQLGTSNRTARENRNVRGFVRAAGSLALARWLEGTLIGSYAYDLYLPFDRLFFPQPKNSSRHSMASAVELVARGSLGRTRFELRPSGRLEWSHTQLRAPASYTGNYPAEKSLLAPTARLGAVVAPAAWLAFSASAATGTRVPTIFELFGDGGLVLRSPGLKPVQSTTYDGGVTVRGKRGVLSGRSELRAFWQQRRDSITMLRTAQYQVGHQNVPSVTQRGVESSLFASIGELFHLSGSFTWLDAENVLGKRLPFRPRFIAYARPEGRVRFDNRWVSSASVSSELWHRSFAFVDDSNLAYSSACTKLAFGAALGLLSRLRFSARLDDSLDARCQDLIGYPLQGRSLFFSLSYQEVEHDAS